MYLATTGLRNGLAPRQKRAADPRDLSVKKGSFDAIFANLTNLRESIDILQFVIHLRQPWSPGIL